MGPVETRGGQGPDDWRVVPAAVHKDGTEGANPDGSVIEGDGITWADQARDDSPNPGGSVLDAGVVIAGSDE